MGRGAVLIDTARREILSSISVLALDVEGCLTDGSKYLSDTGEIFLQFSAIDGLGVWLLERVGVRVAVISASSHQSIAARCKQMEVSHCALDVNDKAEYLRVLVANWSTNLSSVCFMGDDLWDLEAMAAAGVSVCPATAQPEIVKSAMFKTHAAGGKGAVREVANHLLSAKGFEGQRLRGLLKD